MNIEAFLLCDAATDQRGKLNVLGAFDHVMFREMPNRFPAIAIVTRIRFEKIEEGEHMVKIFIIDADGNPVGPKPEGKVNVRMAGEARSSVANLILNIQGLEFARFGSYQVDLVVDGNVCASLPLTVGQVPTAQS